MNGLRTWCFSVVAISMLPAQAVLAQVSCGDTITSNTKLTADLSCDTDPALTVEGPARLDLNGYTVTCESVANDGITLSGRNAKLANGRVTGCDRGVRLPSPGRNNIGIQHHVSNVVAEDNSIGIAIGSFASHVVGNILINNSYAGIRLLGARRTRIVNNTIIGEGSSGSFDVGIYLEDGNDNNDILNNEAWGSDFGILLEYDNNENILIGNITSENGIGISVDDDGNSVIGNVAENNDQVGIELVSGTFGGAENTSVSGNTALGNGIVDLQDLNIDCGTNKWQGNTFESSNEDCIN